MEIQALKQVLQENGIVGAGGAGFPTYAKLDERAEIIIMNCAECEPLLKLHRQLLEQKAEEILWAFAQIAETVGAKEAVIGIKEEYKATLEALYRYIDAYPNMRIQLLAGAYPMGDEVVLIYEATGRVIRPGGLPIEEGVAVFNVETVYNVYRALAENAPVADKLVTVVGEVEHPVTVRVPLGTTIAKTVAYAGKILVKNPAFLAGGPMMGNLCLSEDVVTKTTNAIIVLDQTHTLIQKKQHNTAIDLKRAASACCQCQTCTDLCPRHALGHPIEPHKFMRSAANQDFQELNVFLDTMFCSSCGLCEMYSCPQSLSPRTLIAEYKAGLRKAGVKAPEGVKPVPVAESREYRKVPEARLAARLGLSQYDGEAPLVEDAYAEEHSPVKKVRILLSQHIGAPAVPVVSVGDVVHKKDVIAKPGKGLSVAIHASIDGVVQRVEKDFVVIAAG